MTKKTEQEQDDEKREKILLRLRGEVDPKAIIPSESDESITDNTEDKVQTQSVLNQETSPKKDQKLNSKDNYIKTKEDYLQSDKDRSTAKKKLNVVVLNSEALAGRVSGGDEDSMQSIPDPEAHAEENGNLNSKADKSQSNKDKPSVNHGQQSNPFFAFGHPSVLEMWNVIESAGIKRTSVNRIFTSDDAVLELYKVVEKRLHYNREQEMIGRLREYASVHNQVDELTQLYMRH